MYRAQPRKGRHDQRHNGNPDAQPNRPIPSGLLFTQPFKFLYHRSQVGRIKYWHGRTEEHRSAKRLLVRRVLLLIVTIMDNEICEICGRYKTPHEGYNTCCCQGIQTYGMSEYPGENRLVRAHPTNPGADWYKRADVDARLKQLESTFENLRQLAATWRQDWAEGSPKRLATEQCAAELEMRLPKQNNQILPQTGR